MEVTKKVKQRLDAGMITKIDLAELLGITRVTLDTRLRRENWKKGEIVLIKQMA